MQRNYFLKKEFTLIIIFLLFGVSVLPGINGNKTITKNVTVVGESSDIISFKNLDSLNIASHLATQDEIDQLKTQHGVYDPTQQHNINGQGNSNILPTEEEWDSMVGRLRIIDRVSSPSGLRGAVDLSNESCFPQVRDQGSQSSCQSWAVAYYANGYMQAKEHDWTDASTGNDDHLLSPAFVYNKINSGCDSGSNLLSAYSVMYSIGVCTETNLSYNEDDYTSWGSEEAWRDAPQYRISTINMIRAGASSPYYNDTDINSIKALIDSGHPINFDLVADSLYDGLGTNDDTINSDELIDNSGDHAQTIVGYNDSWPDPGFSGEIGAFKIVNSWGPDWGTTWGPEHGETGNNWGGDGFYWITYEAIKKRICGSMFYGDIQYLSDEHPQLLGVFQVSMGSRNAPFEMGIGSSLDVSDTIYMAMGRSQSALDLPYFMCVDVTEFYIEWISGATDFHLMVGDTTGTDVRIFDYQIEYYKDAYVPGDPFLISTDTFGEDVYYVQCPADIVEFFPLVYNPDKDELYTSIQDAIDNADIDDTLEVFSGIYKEHITIDKSINLISRDKDTTVIDGSGSGTVVSITADKVKMSGFIIQNSGDTYKGIYVSSNENVICGNNVTNNDNGIWVEGNNNVISNNLVLDNTEAGIYVTSANDNVISGNIAQLNNKGIVISSTSSKNIISCNTAYTNDNSGIYLNDGRHSIVNGNTIYDNERGIFLDASEYNVISGNNIYENQYGIYLSGSDDNIITQNNIESNTNKGLYLTSSAKQNIIYHNNFISNSQHVQNDGGSNTWYRPYNNSGNYWSGHSTTDDFSGSNQNENDGDGICDLGGDTGGLNPYSITGIGNGADNYPFVASNGWISWGYKKVHNVNTANTYSTIGAAISGASTNHKILADAGTYNERVIIGKKIILIGAERTNTMIYRAIGNAVNITTDGVKLCGFFLNTTQYMYANATEVMSDDNMIVGNLYRSESDGISIYNHDGNIICSNIFDNTDNSGLFLYYCENNTVCGNTFTNPRGTGLCLSASKYNFVGYNTVTDNEWEGIFLTFGTKYNILHYNTIYHDEVPEQGWYGIYLYATSQNNKLYNNFVSNQEHGIGIIGSDGNILKGNIAVDNENGITIQHNVRDSVLCNNDASDNADSGILLENNCDYNYLYGNIANNNDKHGINMTGDNEYNVLRGNRCNFNGENGINIVDESDLNDIVGNTAVNNGYAGVNVYSSDYTEIILNNLLQNDYGVYITADSDYTILDRNNVLSSNIEGIHVSCSYTNAKGNIVNDNPKGICISGGTNHEVNDCIVRDNEYGICIDSSDYNTLLNNTIQTFIVPIPQYGITLSGSDHNTISGNTIEGETWSNGYDAGIYLQQSSDNILTTNDITNSLNDGVLIETNSIGNTVSWNNLSGNGMRGVRVSSSGSNIIGYNTVNNTEFGIFVENSPNMEIYNNVFNRGGINIEGNLQNHWDTHIIHSNTLNDRPIFYTDMSGGVVPLDAAQVILGGCTGYTANNLNIYDVFAGVQLGYCTECIVSSSTIEECEFGVYLYESDANNQIYDNTIQNNAQGVFLGWSDDNQIFENTIKDNDFGIQDVDSQCPNSNGLIYNNYLIENMEQAFATGNYQWYFDGTIGGNYWSDYTGIDDDYDGFGDTPYVIPPISRQDLYPIYDNPPNEPSNPNPSNSSFIVDLDVNLSWTGGDPDNDDTVTYDVYFGDITPPPQVASDYPDTTYDLGTLNDDTRYYWKIVARDSYYKTTEGPEWTFSTEEAPLLFYPTDDAHTDELQPDNNEGYIPWFKIRRGGTGAEVDGLIKFDISFIPSGSTVITASVHAYYNSYQTADPAGRTINFHCIQEDWDEGTVTWNNQPSHTQNISSSVIMPTSPGQWVQWDVSGDVQDFIDGMYDNYGWKLIEPTPSGSLPLIYFGSKDHADPDYHPYLEIEYVIQQFPEITDVTLTTSDPLDTDEPFGWENFSCTVTDNTAVDEVKLVLTGDTTTEYPMIKDGDTYYCNITISTADEYTYHIWANDTSNNYAESASDTFPLPLNEDVNEDGSVGFVDIMMVAGMWNAEGPNGWDRADVDNNGDVGFVDIMMVAGMWGQEW